MKKLVTLLLLLPLFSVSAANEKSAKKAPTKNKSAHAKVTRHHERNWHQPEYGYAEILFKCHDSWGDRIRGKFNQEQKYFIQLGGGSCHRIQNNYHEYGNLHQITQYGFPVDDVYKAIRKIKKEYGLRRARVVEAENIYDGFKTFKYTLIFDVQGYGYREFRVKHSRWSGKIKNIYEV